ncbi:MAG: hypothetical protein IKN56_07860 [Clostridia bacterium]|nr:hypothetical protein [Clostridia bacterium]
MKKVMILALVLIIPALLLAGCGAKNEPAAVKIAGVSSAERAAGMLTEAYKVKENVKFSTEIADSEQALDSLKSGKADIALIDRGLTDEEKASGLSETAFASLKDSAENVIYIIAPQDIGEAAAGFRDYILSPDVSDILSSAGLVPAGN